MYLHKDACVCHRDIRPDNIVYASRKDGTDTSKEDRAQLTDFHLCHAFPQKERDIIEEDESTKTPSDFKVTGKYGAPEFMAPEQLTGEPYNPKAVDVW